MTSHFEDWCESQGIHPEAFGAWESYQATAAATPAATPRSTSVADPSSRRPAQRGAADRVH